jgi:WhiB family redox-sensing transcriptional regulator
MRSAANENLIHRKTPLMKQSWRQQAACRGLDPAIFYPASDDDEESEAAQSVCAQCTVREACLEFALAVREKQGVWGGCTERDRRRIVRQRRRAS